MHSFMPCRVHCSEKMALPVSEKDAHQTTTTTVKETMSPMCIAIQAMPSITDGCNHVHRTRLHIPSLLNPNLSRVPLHLPKGVWGTREKISTTGEISEGEVAPMPTIKIIRQDNTLSLFFMAEAKYC